MSDLILDTPLLSTLQCLKSFRRICNFVRLFKAVRLFNVTMEKIWTYHSGQNILRIFFITDFNVAWIVFRGPARLSRSNFSLFATLRSKKLRLFLKKAIFSQILLRIYDKLFITQNNSFFHHYEYAHSDGNREPDNKEKSYFGLMQSSFL